MHPNAVVLCFQSQWCTAETVKAVRRRVRAMLKLPKEVPVHLVDFGGTAQGDDVPEETKEEVVHYRHIYFKLPLEGVRFHWRFRDRPRFDRRSGGGAIPCEESVQEALLPLGGG